MINEIKGSIMSDYLSKKIRLLRAKMGLTQEQYAAVVGVTFSTVNRWEKGKSRPSPLALKQMEELKRKARFYWL
jgi:putative transcriptional regulator